MMKRITILFLTVSTMHATINKIDINYSTFEELSTLPLSTEKIISIRDYIKMQKIEDIYDLLDIGNINIKDVHNIRSFVKINNPDKQEKTIPYALDTNIPREMLSYPKKYNANEITYDQLNQIPNVSPIDAVAILKQQKLGEIKGTFQLKNSPGISYYGYKNVLKNILFDEDLQQNIINKPIFRYETIVNTYSSAVMGDDDEGGESITYSRASNPSMFHRLHLSNPRFSASYLRYNNSGDSYGTYTNKMHLEINDVKLVKFSNKEDPLKIDHLIFGNFSATYGQGLVFASGDFNRSRFTGYKFNKRVSGISPDISHSEELTLNGIALQLSNQKLRFSTFFSEDKRDAILNEDGSFTSLIFMRPRLGLGEYDNQEDAYGNMLDALTERTFGLNLRLSVNEGTNIGLTYYESLYDRVLDPQIINTVTGGLGDTEPELDDSDDDDYSGDAFYLNYPASNSADSELNAMYADASGSNHFKRLSHKWSWDEAKSSRMVWGVDFNTIIENIAFQFEYAMMDKNKEDMFDPKKGHPTALIINGFWKLSDNFDFLIVHRNYDLEFDNPYQKSFSNYQRYKSSIIEDSYWLSDPIYMHLHSSTPQPQSEKGTYIESRYQFHQNFVLGLQWDTWLRKADNAKYYRMVSKLEWRPLFNYRIYFRYKLQSRSPYTTSHHNYFLQEARIRFKLRLSNYNHLELLSSWSNIRFAPRPRLSESSNAYALTVGDGGSPDESIGFNFKHQFYNDTNVKLELNAGAIYAHGFLWYIDYNEFRTFNKDFGLVNIWFSFGVNPTDNMAVSLKASHTWTTPDTRVIGGMSPWGPYINDTYILEEKLDFRLQIDYEI